MKARIITAAVGPCGAGCSDVLFNTPVFEIVIALITLIAIHEIYTAFDLGKTKACVWGVRALYLFGNVFGLSAIKVVLVPLSFCLCCIWQSA